MSAFTNLIFEISFSSANFFANFNESNAGSSATISLLVPNEK